MKTVTNSGRQGQAGSAMLIAIFTLLLISVIAIAMVVSSGTDTSLASNYRTSTGAYYAALAGIEEARGRLLWKNPNYINKANAFPTMMTTSGVPTWGLTQVLYIVNPAAGETVDPTSANSANYPDTEYQSEYWPLGGSAVNEINSVSPAAGLPGPSYKWVRITAATEKSIGIDVDGNGIYDAATPLYYDPANPSTKPGLIVTPVPPLPRAVQALELTALSVMPTGSRRMLQYVVVPVVISPSTLAGFPGALTLDGNGVVYQVPPTLGTYAINGQDGCNAAPASVESIAYTNAADYAPLFAQVSPDKASFPGTPMNLSGPPPGTYVAATPSISPVPSTLDPAWQSPAGLDGIVEDITNSADVVINGNATGTDILNRAPTMSVSNPMTVVVNGDLNLAGWHNSGFGLLLVTGTLYYDPDATWNGSVLVIGQGVFSSSRNGSGGINGSVFVAKTRDGSGNLLPVLGSAFFGSVTSYGSTPGFGINYSSCAGQSPLGPSALGPLSYKVLSFREIPLTN